MTKKTVFAAALALVIVGLVAPSASAVCPVGKAVATYNSGTGAFTYWHTTLTDPGATLVAKFWQPGGADSTGTCNTQPGVLYFTPDFASSGNIGISINLADACAVGCAVGQLAFMATANGSDPADPLHRKQTQFLLSQAPETPGTVSYDFSTFTTPPHNMAAIPRPRITSSSKAGTIVTAGVTVDAVAAGAFEGTAGLITGYNILSKLANADPGRNASAYDTGPTLASSNGGAASSSVQVDCTGGSPALARRFVVTQLLTPAGPSPTVSEATVVSCDGSLAEPPGGKYKIVPKPKVAPNSKKAN
jgi:hypothetical protein